MVNQVYESISRYYNTLDKLGYMSYDNVMKLLVYTFYMNYVYNDFRGYISREDYMLIDKALYCLYGSTCLIPYPEYLKMGSLNIGSVTELAKRVENLEDKNVLKLIHNLNSVENDIDSDIMIVAEDEE